MKEKIPVWCEPYIAVPESMKEKILTEGEGQKLSINWDGTRFAIIEEWDKKHGYGGKWVIVLSPREAQEAADFINARLNTIIGAVEK